MDKLPRGCTRKPNGIRVRVNHKGRKEFDKTITGNPYSAALIAEARALATHVRECLALGIPIQEDRPTTLFSDAAQSFLNRCRVDADVRTKYRNTLQAHWMPLFHNKALQQITTADIQNYVDDRLGHLKIKTQRNYVSPLRLVLDHGKIKPNPVDGLDWNEKQAKAEKPVRFRFKPTEQDKIISALDHLHQEAIETRAKHPMKRFRAHWTEQARVYFPLIFGAGLRPGEALALRWSDWDGERLHIHATHSQGKRKEATKTGDTRRVYVPQWVRPRLEDLPSKFKKGAMFLGNHGDPLMKKNNLNVIWRDALNLCGYEHQDPYVARHSRAAELLSMGKASLAECAYQMGHSVVVFQYVYAKFMEEFSPSDFSQFEPEVARELPQWQGGEVIKLGNTKG